MSPFPTWNQSVVPCLDLIVASWAAYRFLKSQVKWSDIPIILEFSSVLWYSQSFGIVNKAEVDIFLKFSCIFYDPMDVGNLNSGSSAFSKANLNIWKFTVHVLLKPDLKDFEHYFARVWM